MGLPKTLVTFSGGLDSAATAYWLKFKGYPLAGGLFVDRGQGNLAREWAAAQNMAVYFKLPLYRATFALPDMKDALTPELLKKLGVPARNLIIASLALPYAKVLDCEMIALGNITSDDFPDCDEQFRMQLTALASHALGGRMRIVAPLADWNGWDKKDEIFFLAAHGEDAIFGLSWTCWLGGEIHCGKCPACESRIDGFKEAGIIDPTPYANRGIK